MSKENKRSLPQFVKKVQECFSNSKNKDDPQQKSGTKGQHQENYIVFLALNAERTEDIIQDLRDSEKLTQEAVSALSRTANIEALWQGTEEDYSDTYQINKCFEYPPQQKDNYDVYLLEIELNEPEKEFKQTMPSTSRQRAFKRLLNKEHSIKVSPRRLPRESIGNNPYLYR